MRPSFNIAGPCIPGEHYMVPPERRLGPALELIDDGKYFTLTAGRQTGKTTSLYWLVTHYRETGTAAAIWVDLQIAREQHEPAVAFDAILRCLDEAVETDLPEVGVPGDRASYLAAPMAALVLYLRDLARRCPLPLVVLFDEADGLIGAPMVSFLTQLRAGYIARSRLPFPRSVVLVGMRQVRDYALAEEERRTVSWLGTTSPSNITADALTLPAFTRADVDIESAKERIILERRTHIDSLIAKLREPRVRRILDPCILVMR